MKHEDPLIRLNTYRFLAVYPAGNPLVPYLARGLLDEDEKVQVLAVRTLQKRPVDPVLLYHTLLPMLDGPSVSARINALKLIWRCGSPALPFLYQALADKHAGVRRAAVSGLCYGSFAAKQVFAKLLPMLKDRDTEVRALAMAGLSPHGQRALAYLALGLKDAEALVRRSAVESLALVFAKPETVLPLLQQALQDPAEEVRIAAAKGLQNFGMDAVPLLLQAFADSSTKVWKRALDSMLGLKADEKVLLPILIKATHHQNPAVRAGAAYALERFAADGVPPLVALLKKDKDPSVLWAVVDTIDTIGMPARAAMPDLEPPALHNPSAKVRYGALVAMIKIHGLGKYRRRLTLEAYQKNIGVVIPHLIESLSSPNADRRWQACLILGVIG
ncbi:MAG: HEAT repeat domain-containing protein, partial [Mariprofundaceae bacterium]|nr:HEAT repeat domain-containing protein [Mariprofundaceae bacterium]